MNPFSSFLNELFPKRHDIETRELNQSQYQQFSVIVGTIMVAASLVAVLFSVWDAQVDSARSSSTLNDRLLIGGLLLIPSIMLLLRVSSHLTFVTFALALLASQYFYLDILNTLRNGYEQGMAGFLSYYILIPIISIVLPIRVSLALLLVITLFPMLLVLPGIAAGMNLATYNIIVWTAFVPTAVVLIILHQLILNLIAAQQKLETFQSSVEEMERMDALTGLYNYKTFLEAAQSAFIQAKRYQQPLSMILLDVDDFKLLNKRHGQTLGDEVVIGLARVIKAFVRRSDIPGRLQGGEFAIVLPQTNEIPAKLFAERLRDAISKTEIQKPTGTFTFTASLGVAELNYRVNRFDDLMDITKQCLTAAKDNGRNRTVNAREINKYLNL